MIKIDGLKIKIFIDGADIESIKNGAQNAPVVKGFTTNPTLMRKAGVKDYRQFAREAISAANGLPISFEVFSDDFDDMERQARIIASWGQNAYVKIPITNTKGASSCPMIKKLTQDGIKVNVTAILSLDQVKKTAEALEGGVPAIVSVFAGRIADTGRDPAPMMENCLSVLEGLPEAELLWASSRELLNVFQADRTGCHIITVTPDLLSKLKLVGRDLEEYSLDTVKTFYNDARSAGYEL
ncbi:MAG: transaldolase [Synergistaceae bacterium]|jgi:transaldolase|nr:transaldolase [Synergistaceae bacterium]